MTLRIPLRFLSLLLIISLLLSIASMVSSAQASLLAQAVPQPKDLGELSPVAEVASGGLAVEPFVQPATQLARQDYQNVYNEAMRLLNIATGFRTNELQLGSTVSCTEVKDDPTTNTDEYADCLKQNYKDFNSGRLFYRFCASFEPQSALNPAIQLDLSSACANWNTLKAEEQQTRVLNLSTPLEAPLDVRNTLLLARDYFGFLALGPAEQQIDQGDVRKLGETGVLSATREIAYVHLIFGTEFMVDAIDYRFSGGINPSADAILQEEIKQLKFAVQQFQQGVDVLAYAFNADFGGPGGKRIGDFFGDREFELFNTVSERLIDSLGELALRYRQLGQEQEALKLYADAFRNQYVQSLAIADSARKNGPSFLLNGGWRLLNNLEHLQARAQAIYNGVNPFGFPPEYVPLQSFTDLLESTRGSDGKSGLYRDAQEDETEAKSAQREFDQNRTALNTELLNLRTTYAAKLLEMCGQQTDYAATCDGGLMKRNYFDMIAALNEVKLAYEGMEQIPAQIEIEQQRAGRVISLITEGGRKISAIEHARALVNYETTTDAVATTNTSEVYGGVEARVTASVCICFPNFGGGVEASLSVFGGTRWSKTHTSSTQTTINYDAIQLGQLNSLQAIEQATNQASIEGANSEATIKGLLLQQVSKLIQYDLALNRYNQVAAEHNALVEQYHMWLNLQNQAQENLADSYLNNPSYRILREHWTVESSRSFNLAAQFVYLTAKSLEYELLTPFPEIYQRIYKARTTDDLDNILNELTVTNDAARPCLSRFPYRISLAKHILGLNDQNLDPTNQLTSQQRIQKRYEEFQRFLQHHIVRDSSTNNILSVEIPFATSLLDNQIFSLNAWNNRIAGLGTKVDPCNSDNQYAMQGVSLNVFTRQLGDVGQPKLLLKHGGHATYRNSSGAIVYYTPENAHPSGFLPPESLKDLEKISVLTASINGNGQGTQGGELVNLSIAASNWVLVINLTTPENKTLDITKIEDIEIMLDSYGYAFGGREQEAQTDSMRLQALFVQ